MIKTCEVCGEELHEVYDQQGEPAGWACAWAAEQPDMHARLSEAVSRVHTLEAALHDARNEVTELCWNFDVDLDQDDWLDLAVKLDEWAELAAPYLERVRNE